LVAERLGFVYVDEGVIERAAARAGVEVERIADEERRKPIFSGLLEYLQEAGTSSPSEPEWTDELPGEEARGFIREAIHEIAAQGDAVIVAHAASFAVGPGPQTLRLLVTAPQETRVSRLSVAGMSKAEAGRAVRRSDANRADYLMRFYGVAQEFPIHYDLVVNTDTIAYEQAAEWISYIAAGQPHPRPGNPL
jgi:hypothetical protein